MIASELWPIGSPKTEIRPSGWLPLVVRWPTVQLASLGETPKFVSGWRE